MSGIAGVFYLDGRPAQTETLGQMVDILAHRGPDGADIWLGGSVGLGHRMLWTTSESLDEKLPFKMSDRVITADARIDNRDELINLLGLSDIPSSEISDSEIILSAYAKWGENCPEKLIGAFAFAIWDEQKQQLFCARDHIGVKPFYFYYSKNIFVFASEIKAILTISEVPKIFNELRVAYHFDPIIMTFIDSDITFYENVYRLLPAHILKISRSKFHKCKYWSLDPEKEIILGSDEEYSQAFLEIFKETVQCRMRSAYPIGGSLSGGLDSSSIVCTAAGLLESIENQYVFHTFSAIFDDVPSADEREYIQAVVNHCGETLNHHYVHPDKESPLVDIDKVLYQMDEPFYGTNYFMPWGFFKSANKDGVRIFMDGTEGDITVSHGMDYLVKLARMGNWKSFASETEAIIKHFNNPRYATYSGILNSYGFPQLTEQIRNLEIRNYLRNVIRINYCLNIPPSKTIKRTGIKPFFPATLLKSVRRLRGQNGNMPKFYNVEFLKRIHFEDKKQSFLNLRKPLSNRDREYHYYDLISYALPYSLESNNKLASTHGIEPRHPFCDKRLIEYCLSLPPEQKLQNGWSRYILRNAMKDILPNKVRWRGGKATLRQVSNNGFFSYEQEFMKEAIFDYGYFIKDYVDLSILEDNFTKYIEQKDPAYLTDIWPAIILIQWFRSQ